MSTLVVAKNTFFILLRDRIFFWIACAITALIFIASALGEWSLDKHIDIFHNFTLIFIEFFGSALAVIWATRALADSSQDGSIEIHLAAPISRASWFFGKYLGIVFALVAINLLFLLIFAGINWLTLGQNLSYPLTISVIFFALYWSIIAAVGVFFTSIASQMIALLTTIGLWFAGLITSSVLQILPPHSEPSTKLIVGFLARYWDLNQYRQIVTWLNSDKIAPETFTNLAYLVVLQGLAIIGVLIAAGCLFFEHKDLNSIS